MKKWFVSGMVLALLAVLAYSCNKNRFDFSQLESVEGSGHWKLPIGSAHITLEQVLSQLNDNNLVSTDENGNLQLQYRFALDPIIKGTDVMKYNDVSYGAHFEVENPYQYVLENPIDTMVVFDQFVELRSESAALHSAMIRSGVLFFRMENNFGEFKKIVLRSDNMFDAEGQPLEKTIEIGGECEVDLAGIRVETDSANVLHYTYEIHYQMYDLLDPQYMFDATIGVRDFCVGMLSGWVKAYAAPFLLDEPFSLPIGNVVGSLKLIDTKLKIQARNSFELMAQLRVDTAELCGEAVAPSVLLDHYPAYYSLAYTPTMSDLLDETLRLEVSTEHDRIYASGEFVFNPAGMEDLVTVYDTASIGVAAEAVMPLKFNIPGIHYLDTIDMKLDEIEYPEAIREVILHLAFESEIPFNLQAQLFTMDSVTGQVTDSLLANEHFIEGAFEGHPVRTEASVSITHERLASLFAANKLIMRFGIDTDDRDVVLNLKNGLGLELKVDVIYDGELYHLDPEE